MHFSRHYSEKLEKSDRGIDLDQAAAVVNNPIRTEAQEDGHTRYWGYVAAIGRYVRVVVEAAGEEIVTAFPDRRFRP